MLYVEPQPIVGADVEIADPDQRKKRDEITPPVREEQLETRDGQKNCRHVMAKAVFAGEKVEELTLNDAGAGPAFRFAELLHFAKNRFVRNCPCHGGHWQAEGY